MSEQEPRPSARRRRRRATAAAGPPVARAVDDAPEPGPGPREVAERTEPPGSSAQPKIAAKRARRARPDSGERALTSLVGSGPSQLGVSGALRGRDVNRPTERDLADADRDLVIVRRHWKPPT